MYRLGLKTLLAFALVFASCKGADEHEVPREEVTDAEAEESSAVSQENGDLLQANESTDTAVTPILVTGTYLTCVDVVVSRSYDYAERGRIVGCHLKDRETGEQVPLERIASDWFWQVDVPIGVIAHQQIVDNERALYPLLLELKGPGKDGRDILETMVQVTLDLLLPVENPRGHILAIVLNEVLNPIPVAELEEQLSPPEVLVPETDSTPQPGQPQTTQPQTTQPQTTQPQTQQSEDETQTLQETEQVGEQPENENPEPEDPNQPSEELIAIAEEEMPKSVLVKFTIVSVPGGATIAMSPRGIDGFAVTEESLRVTGQIIAESLETKGTSQLFRWRFPVEVSFRLDGKVTCRGDGFAGTTALEVTTKCQ